MASAPSDLNAIFEMTRTLGHRGPDGSGHLFFDGARTTLATAPSRQRAQLALGHTRLAIIDCTSAGSQPMAAADGSSWIVYNGEVYNYLELRSELASLGCVFHNDTDTEVVLAAYRTWGTRCLERFNGMWALAIWDASAQRLVLSRDRLGVKPLYLAFAPGRLAFASEIKSILASGLIEPKVEAGRVIDYLKWGMVDHDDRTFFRDVVSMPAGSYAEFDLSAMPDRCMAQSYWTLSTRPDRPGMGMREASEHFLSLFKSAVSLRLRSDVPVGSCLSGGLDSSAIVAMASLVRPAEAGPLQTFTAVAEEPRLDERRWAQIVNHHVGAQGHFVMPTADSFCSDVSDLVWHQDQPFTTTSIYAQWLVMKRAREAGVPVLLDGQGGDEVLCGYRKYYVFWLQQLARERRWGSLAHELLGLTMRGDRGLLRWREGTRYLPRSLRRTLPSLADFVAGPMRRAWEDSELHLGLTGDVQERQIGDLLRFSVPALLRYEDRNSMAWSVESRVPFLDYRLVESMVALGAELKMAAGRTKAVMREALRGILPAPILMRRDKLGFGTSERTWIHGALGSRMRAAFAAADFPAHPFLDQRLLLAGFDRLLARQSTASHGEFVRAYILVEWMRRFDVRC